ncbi:hypothetical protein EV360DRAFT_69932 [Lentinula raphanica]|nr:hypothetical protein EV360DRAFT_69932 [Lentinula raphanica]
MSVWNDKGYSDFQALKPKVDDLIAWELGNEFDSLPPTSQQTNDFLNIEELRETIRLAKHQLLQYKMQLCWLILGHYHSLNALFNETKKTVGMAPRFDGFNRPVSCSNSTGLDSLTATTMAGNSGQSCAPNLAQTNTLRTQRPVRANRGLGGAVAQLEKVGNLVTNPRQCGGKSKVTPADNQESVNRKPRLRTKNTRSGDALPPPQPIQPRSIPKPICVSEHTQPHNDQHANQVNYNYTDNFIQPTNQLNHHSIDNFGYTDRANEFNQNKDWSSFSLLWNDDNLHNTGNLPRNEDDWYEQDCSMLDMTQQGTFLAYRNDAESRYPQSLQFSRESEHNEQDETGNYNFDTDACSNSNGSNSDGGAGGDTDADSDTDHEGQAGTGIEAPELHEARPEPHLQSLLNTIHSTQLLLTMQLLAVLMNRFQLKKDISMVTKRPEDILKLLYKDTSFYRSTIKRKIHPIVVVAYKLPLVEADLPRSGNCNSADEDKTNNIVHPCLCDSCVQAYYNESTVIAQKFPDQFSTSVPIIALAFVMTVVRNCIEEYKDGPKLVKKELSSIKYCQAFKCMVGILNGIKAKNVLHWNKVQRNLDSWAQAGCKAAGNSSWLYS